MDIVCYRRHGHNELDEPSFTQPLTYAEIARHQCVLELYTKELIDAGVVDADFVKSLSVRVWEEFEAEYQAAAQYMPDKSEWLSSNWQGEAINALLNSGTRPYNLTGVPLETLTAIGRAACEVPEWCTPAPPTLLLPLPMSLLYTRTPAQSRKRRAAPGLHAADNPLAPRIRRPGTSAASWYGVRDAACPISTR